MGDQYVRIILSLSLLKVANEFNLSSKHFVLARRPPPFSITNPLLNDPPPPSSNPRSFHSGGTGQREVLKEEQQLVWKIKRATGSNPKPEPQP